MVFSLMAAPLVAAMPDGTPWPVRQISRSGLRDRLGHEREAIAMRAPLFDYHPAPVGEWNHESVLDWELLNADDHRGLRQWLDDLNRLYRREAALHKFDCDPRGFQWLDCHDSEQSVLTFLRQGVRDDPPILVACNFTPVPRVNYRVGAPAADFWEEVLNSDAPHYGGSGWGNSGRRRAVAPALPRPTGLVEPHLAAAGGRVLQGPSNSRASPPMARRPEHHDTRSKSARSTGGTITFAKINSTLAEHAAGAAAVLAAHGPCQQTRVCGGKTEKRP